VNTAEILIVGDEILIGQTFDTNSNFISQKLNKLGFDVQRIVVVSDNPKAISSYLDRALFTSKLIIITGGLGPTNDDLTKHTLSSYFGSKLVLNYQVLQHIKDLFKNKYNSPINKQNEQQALLPDNARIFINKYGTASGMWFTKNEAHCISLPGVPYEMKALLVDQIIPAIERDFQLPFNYYRTINTIGLGESNIAQRLVDWENQLDNRIKVAYLPRLGKVRIRISTTDNSNYDTKKRVDDAVKKLIPLITDIYFGQDQEQIHEIVAKLLSENSLSISCAESYTGGAFAAQICSLAGSSKYFKGGIVAYDKESKTKMLRVPDSLINHLGVANDKVVGYMARGAIDRFGSDLAIATSGNAGPTRGDKSVPVGRVYIAIAYREKTSTYEFKMNGPRSQVIERSLNKINELLFHTLSEIIK